MNDRRTERDDVPSEHDTGPPFVPDEKWIDAFQAQATDELCKKAKRFARSRARVVASAGGRADDYYISALVQDVLTDTLFGVLTWDPAAMPLETHVLKAIRSRSHHDSVRARKFQHRSIDAFDTHGEANAMMVEVESSLSFDQYTPSAEALTFSDEVISCMRRLAVNDRAVLRMLSAIGLGATERPEIMQLARMSPKTYHKAHIRLSRLVERLPNDVLTGLRSRA